MPAALCGGASSGAVTLSIFSPLPPFVNGSFATEPGTARAVRAAGIFSNFGASFDANGTARTLQVRKNSANANSQLKPADSTAQIVYNNTNTDHFAATDTLDLQFVGTAPAYTVNFCKFVYTADTGHATINGTSIAAIGTGGTGWFPLQGTANATAEANAQTTMRTSGTIKNAVAYVAAASTTAATLVSRIGGVTGNLTVSITANTTGIFEDTTHSDNFSNGSLVAFQLTGQTTGSQIGSGIIITYNATANEVWTQSSAITFSASDQFFPFVGNAVTLSTTESIWKLKHGFACNSSNFRAFIAANTMTGTTTFKTRINGADGNQTLSVGTTLTGLFEDKTNIDSYGATDDANFVVRGGTSGTITPSTITITEIIPPGLLVYNQQTVVATLSYSITQTLAVHT